MQTTSAEHGHVLPMFCTCSFHGNSSNNFLSYCGLVDARISAFEKDVPVSHCFTKGQLISKARAEIQKNHSIFGSNENFKICI